MILMTYLFFLSIPVFYSKTYTGLTGDIRENYVERFYTLNEKEKFMIYSMDQIFTILDLELIL